MKRLICFFLLSLNFADAVHADLVNHDEEAKRRSGFMEHKQENQIFDREREKAKNLWLEELEQWERERRAALLDYKKTEKIKSPEEGGVEHQEDRRFKQSLKREYESAEKEYLKEKSLSSRQRQKNIALSEEEELDLYVNRPRYDFKRRQRYKGKISSFGSSGSSGSSFGGGNDGFPAPPSFEGFGNENYVPPPVMPDAPEDFPPPPPPTFDSGDFPPPPPPPPPWDGEGSGY